jgi:integrase
MQSIDSVSNPKCAEWLEEKSTKSLETSVFYSRSIRNVLGDSPDNFLNLPAEKKQELLSSYIKQEKGKVSGATLRSRLATVRSFSEWNMVEGVNWKRLISMSPERNTAADDRPPSVEEVRKLLSVCGAREKAAVMILTTSGCRIGALPCLRLEDLEDIEIVLDNGTKVSLAKLRIYAHTKHSYTTFITSEALGVLREYLKSRELAGEILTPKSFLLRNDFNRTATLIPARKQDSISSPKPVHVATLRNLLWKLWILSGTRDSASVGTNARWEFSTAHGFRKFFKTRLENSGMRTLMIEFCMGHATGLQGSYFKPSSQELAKEYAKHANALAISEAIHLQVKLETQEADFREQFQMLRADIADLRTQAMLGKLQQVSSSSSQPITVPS